MEDSIAVMHSRASTGKGVPWGVGDTGSQHFLYIYIYTYIYIYICICKWYTALSILVYIYYMDIHSSWYRYTQIYYDMLIYGRYHVWDTKPQETKKTRGPQETLGAGSSLWITTATPGWWIPTPARHCWQPSYWRIIRSVAWQLVYQSLS